MTKDEVKAMSDEELSAFVAEKWYGKWNETRCRICGWPLQDAPILGCYQDDNGNLYCSMRPTPERRADAVRPYASDHYAALDLLFRVQAETSWAMVMLTHTLADAEFDGSKDAIRITYHQRDMDKGRAFARCVAEAAALIERSNDG